MTEIIYRISNINYDSDTDTVVDHIPGNLKKLVSKFEILKNKITMQKKTLDDVFHEIKSFEKTVNSFIKKQIKENDKKSKKPRKKSGFALPAQVSDEMCEFIGIDKGTHLARTDVTKFLMAYIEDNKLENEKDKRFIVPDEKLSKLLGEEAKDKKITHFTIQKYINKHFIRIRKTLINEFVPNNPDVPNPGM